MAITKDPQFYLTLIEDYYKKIDSGKVDEILMLFSPYAKYNRTGVALLCGLSEIEHFFREVRQLQGRHLIYQKRVEVKGGGLVIVSTRGHFEGTSQGKPVLLRFKDVWHFPQGRPTANFRRSIIHPLPLTSVSSLRM